jgi:hypothetical protein
MKERAVSRVQLGRKGAVPSDSAKDPLEDCFAGTPGI